MNAKANSGAALQNSEIVSRLNTLLADYQIHYQNLRGLHWNIQGRSFFTLHSVFEQYYNQAAERIDALAERILMLGGKPLHTYQDYLDTRLAERPSGHFPGRPCRGKRPGRHPSLAFRPERAAAPGRGSR